MSTFANDDDSDYVEGHASAFALEIPVGRTTWPSSSTIPSFIDTVVMCRLPFLVSTIHAVAIAFATTLVPNVLAPHTLTPSISAQEILSVPPGVLEEDNSAALANPVVDLRPSWQIDDQTLDQLHGPLLRRDITITSAQSCAASNCHGGPVPGIAQPRARRGSEYQLWLENDPHARSWRTICGTESVAMMERLGIMDTEHNIIDQAGFDNCLACHNTTARFDETRSLASIQEGVGCNACHGPAEKWINQHYQYSWSADAANSTGFVRAGDLFTRARMCVSCHVGDKDRDMNHDIIAAGHPTLQFEMATYHAWQPKHWRDAESQDESHYEAKLWLAGQIASADAALALIESRASGSHTVSQWPELASYDCSSCHHGLGLDNARVPNARATASSSQWNYAGLQWLIRFRVAEGRAGEHDQDLQSALNDLSRSMESSGEPRTDSTAAVAKRARHSLARWFDSASGIEERSNFGSRRLAKLVAFTTKFPSAYVRWESATQLYLAAVAARDAWPGGWNGELRRIGDQMQRGLSYPDSIDVSRMAKRGTASSPPATRQDITRLGMAFGNLLVPHQDVVPNVDRESIETLPVFDSSELENMLQEMESRWRSEPQPKPRDSKVPTDRDDKSPADSTPADTKPTAPKQNKPEVPEDDPQKVLQELEEMLDSIRRTPER